MFSVSGCIVIQSGNSRLTNINVSTKKEENELKKTDSTVRFTLQEPLCRLLKSGTGLASNLAVSPTRSGKHISQRGALERCSFCGCGGSADSEHPCLMPPSECWQWTVSQDCAICNLGERSTQRLLLSTFTDTANALCVCVGGGGALTHHVRPPV